MCAARNSSPPCSAFPFSAGRLAAFVQQEVSLPGGRGSVASHMLAQGMLNVFIWKGFIKCISKARVSEQQFYIYIYFFFPLGNTWEAFAAKPVALMLLLLDLLPWRPRSIPVPFLSAVPGPAGAGCCQLCRRHPAARGSHRVRALLRAAEFGSRRGFGLW